MSRYSFSVAAAAVLLVCAAQVHALVNCQWQGPSASYDLTPLAGTDIAGSDATYNYIARVCGTASETNCAAKNGSFCQYSKTPVAFQHVLSKWTPTGGVWSTCTDMTTCPNGGVQLQYTNGDTCSGTGTPRQTTYVVACGSGTSTEYAVVEPGTCQYKVVFTHVAGCGVGPSSSSGTVNPVAVSSTGGAPSGSPPYTCQYTDSATSLTYDLSALYWSGDLADNEVDYNYQLHFCSNVTESKCWAQGGNFCQYNKQSGAYVHAISRWSLPSATQWTACTDPDHCQHGGVEVTIANGDRCAGGLPRNVTFQVACDQTGTQTAYTVEERVGAPCSYLVRLAHTAGCGYTPQPPPPPPGGGSNGGKIAGAVIGVLLGVALLGGGFWYYKYRYLPSRDAGMDTGMSNTGATSYQAQV